MIWLKDALKQLSAIPTTSFRSFLPRNWKKAQKIKTEGQDELAQNRLSALQGETIISDVQ